MADGGGTGIRLVHKDDDREPIEGIQFVKLTGDALDLVGPGTVVGGTAWLWAHPDAIGCLDVLVIDEAGQMALAQALAAARSSRNLLLLGDPQQLEQPTKGAHEDGADVAALVHMLGPSQATLRPDQGLFLDTTYRLHPTICQFTSEAYYEGRLLPAPGREIQRIGGSTAFAGSGLCLVNVWHQGNQAHSVEEIDVVTRVVRSLLQADTTWTDVLGQTRRLEEDDILVVAPYNAQVSALKRGLAPFQVTRVGDSRQVSGPGGARRDLFVHQFLARGCSARHVVSVRPASVQRRDQPCAQHGDCGCKPEAFRARLPCSRADFVGERLLSIRGDGGTGEPLMVGPNRSIWHGQ